MRLAPSVLKRTFLLIYLAILTCSASDNSSDDNDKTPNENLTEGLRALDASKRSQILQILDSLEIPFRELKGAHWKHRKNTYLVILMDSLSGKPSLWSNGRSLWEGVYGFDVSRSKVKIMATPVFGSNFICDTRDTVDGFDFSPYQISPKEFAFGVRYSRHHLYATGEAWMKGIKLFRIKDSTITQIANIPTWYETNLKGDCEEEGYCRIETSEKAFILVTKKKTSGYFDWIKRTDNGKSVRLVWKDGGYVLKGNEPFPVKEFNIFEECGP